MSDKGNKNSDMAREYTVEDWLGKDNTLGIDIFNKKYRYKDETFLGWVHRVSGGDLELKKLILEKKFLFGGRILSNRGIPDEEKKTTLSNCYVIASPEDSIESIFDSGKKIARTFSYGGGCGIDLSNLSPNGAKVRNAAETTSGVVSFMDYYSMITGLISQHGRRGALMITLSCDHPDLEEFIKVKTDLNRVTKANISIRVTDEFMAAVRYDRNHVMEFTRPETGEVIRKEVPARKLFKLIAETNWDYAEPGMLFWDTITKHSMLDGVGEYRYVSTNPCSEIPLNAGGACLLGSLNISEFVIYQHSGSYGMDWKALNQAVDIAVRALNDVLDEGIEKHPLDEQVKAAKRWRQIGLGIFGLADALIKMGIKYGSHDALFFCDNLMTRILDRALYTSAMLVGFDKDGHYKPPVLMPEQVMKSSFYKKHANCLSASTTEAVQTHGLRNATLLAIAPTGTIATMLNVSTGAEPNFAFSYNRRTQSLHGEDVTYKVYAKIAQDYMDEHSLTDEEQLPDYFISAQDIPYVNRIEMQAILQKHIDSAISSTINLPASATVEDVMDIYTKAWQMGCKGITVFRDNSARLGILTTDSADSDTDSDTDSDIHDTVHDTVQDSIQDTVQDNTQDNIQTLRRGDIIRHSDDNIIKLRTVQSGCGKVYAHAHFDRDTGDLVELFLDRGGSGGCERYMNGLSRMVSLAARGGVFTEDIIDQLLSVGPCAAYARRRVMHGDTSRGACCPNAIGYALEEMWQETVNGLLDDDYEDDDGGNHEDDGKNEGKGVAVSASQSDGFSLCPACHKMGLTNEGGCNVCKLCGWSRCD